MNIRKVEHEMASLRLRVRELQSQKKALVRRLDEFKRAEREAKSCQRMAVITERRERKLKLAEQERRARFGEPIPSGLGERFANWQLWM